MPYQINEIFYSIQGEGIRAGTPNVFIRFSGCNQTCLKETHGFDCDTEFVSGVRTSAEEIAARAREIAPECDWVILTGGEPLLQVDEEICALLRRAGFEIAIETNGSINPPAGVLEMLSWIACSPKVAEHAVRLERCDELRYVRGHGQGIPKPRLSNCPNKLISPAFSGNVLEPEVLSWCLDLVKNNPEWRLSVQTHKFLNVR